VNFNKFKELLSEEIFEKFKADFLEKYHINRKDMWDCLDRQSPGRKSNRCLIIDLCFKNKDNKINGIPYFVGPDLMKNKNYYKKRINFFI
jgi:hypothetical protein